MKPFYCQELTNESFLLGVEKELWQPYMLELKGVMV
jgi:hypothetical protein